ncbi:MAG: nitroreductase family protein [Rhizobiaceae bacterium]
MKTRRSAVSLTLEEPGPDAGELRGIIEIASRVPDHGKLAPWRFVLWEKPAREAMHGALLDLLDSLEHIEDKPKKRAGTDKLLHAPCVVAVISQAAEHPKIPVWEQQLSAGAACMNMLIGANSRGYEAQWLTAWYVYEDTAREILQLNQGERIAGIIHIGSTSTPKTKRARPDIDDILSIRTA